jgi:protoheme IX farnesyltransferase
VDPGALILVMIIFTWTPPHFWALAIERKDDYARAGIPMLPVTHGVPHTRLQILIYTIALILVSFGPTIYGMSGWIYSLAAASLGAGFLYHAWLLYRDRSPAQPMRTFRFSIWYLTLLFTALVVDHYVNVIFALPH